MTALQKLYSLVEKTSIDIQSIQGQPDLVREIQSLLTKAGYPLKVDGILGEKTLAAFAQFKADEYLEAPRLIGKTSIDTLRTAAAEGDRARPYNQEDETPRYKGRVIKVAGYGDKFTDEPIIKDGSFTWGEATHGGSRLPESKEVSDNMINLAIRLQAARDKVGKPFEVTSWYRPPAINRRVGGASRSQHLYGKAVDIHVQGETGRSLARKLHWWNGGLGIYSDRPLIIHLDIGSYRRWGI